MRNGNGFKRKCAGTWIAVMCCLVLAVTAVFPGTVAYAVGTTVEATSEETAVEAEKSEAAMNSAAEEPTTEEAEAEISTGQQENPGTDLETIQSEADSLPTDASDGTTAETDSTETLDSSETGQQDISEISGESDSNSELPTENDTWVVESSVIEDTKESADTVPSITYQVHGQDYGWQTQVKDGSTAGTVGKSKRVEGIKISLANLSKEYAGSSLTYSAHVQDIGWQSAVSDGNLAGTTGQSKRLEAITITLHGSISVEYSVYYRVHVQDYGWLGWAKDGEKAGTLGMSKRVEAIQIMLVKKGSSAPTSTGSSYKCSMVSYQAHMQDYGWGSTVYDNAVAGVTGQSKRMEALRISLPNVKEATGHTGGIAYQVYLQDVGWQEWKSDGELAGSIGKSRRIEAIRIKLTGTVATYYDVYYSLHLSNVGWTNYVKGSGSAVGGSTNLSKRIEGIKIQLVKKSGGTVPATGGTTYIEGYANSDLTYTVNVQGGTKSGPVTNGQTAGTTGQSKRLEGITINLNQSKANMPSGTISYSTHVSNVGWTGWSTTGTFSGSSDGSNGLEAIKITLNGNLAKYYDIYYRAYIQNYGWLGWAKNGQAAGSTNIGYRMEAVQIKLVSKDAAAPGANSGYYTETPVVVVYTGPDAAMTAKANQYSSPTKYIIMVDCATHKVGIYQGAKGSWSNVKYWSCGDGKSSTPTVRGVFSVGSKGYYFTSGKYRCFWYTQFYGNYLFHSVLCWPDGTIADGRVGLGISHGCVRLEVENAKWIYDNIPKGTTVVVYN